MRVLDTYALVNLKQKEMAIPVNRAATTQTQYTHCDVHHYHVANICMHGHYHVDLQHYTYNYHYMSDYK